MGIPQSPLENHSSEEELTIMLISELVLENSAKF